MAGQDKMLIPVQRALVHDTAVLANADMLAADIAPTLPPSIFRVMISFDTATRFEVDITNGGDLITAYFNKGVDLVADSLYIFDIVVDEGDTFNFQSDTNANINVFRVIEIPAAI